MALSDAKRALKLHHTKGISLKQAWKMVKCKGKKTKTCKKLIKRVRSQKKRRVYRKKTYKKKRKMGKTKLRALAKKAMMLHHKKGISLKQAWKKVLKFGDCGGEHRRKMKFGKCGCGR